jgi:signal transduction histidine kinase
VNRHVSLGIVVATIHSLARVSGYSKEQILQKLGWTSLPEDREWVNWSDFCHCCRISERILEGPKEMAALGREMLRDERMKWLMDCYSAFFETDEVFELSFKLGGILYFPTMKTEFVKKGSHLYEAQMSLFDTLEECPEFFKIAAGMLEAIPTVHDQEPALVRTVLFDRGATFTIVVPESNVWKQQLRRAFHFWKENDRSSLKSILHQLADKHSSLLRQWQNAEELCEEANKLRMLAQDAVQIREEFLLTVSHEFRTPLNSIVGLLSILRTEELPAKQHRQLELAFGASLTLMSLIENMLDLSKAELRSHQVEHQDFQLQILLDDLLDLMSARLLGKNVQLVGYLDPQLPPWIRSDAKRIHHLLLNLIDNAIRYTERGDVVVAIRFVKKEGDKIQMEFSVRDDGVGIASHSLPFIFQPFFQTASSSPRQQTGTGLGLAISQRICQMLNSELRVESELNRGSRFWFELECETSIYATDNHSSVMMEKEVWLIDSNETFIRYLDKQLRGQGINVRVFSNADHAYRISQESSLPDLVICESLQIVDQRMESTHSLVGALGRTETPLVLVAPHSNYFSRDYSSEISLVGVVHKPLGFGTLSEMVHRNWKTRESLPFVEEISAKLPEVLFIGQDTVTHELLKALMAGLQFEITIADHPIDAFRICRGIGFDIFDVIILDNDMPLMDIETTVQIVRKQMRNAGLIPCVALVSEDSTAVRERMKTVHIGEILTKPLTRMALKLCLERCLRNVQTLNNSVFG